MGYHDLGATAFRERDEAAGGRDEISPLDLGRAGLSAPDEGVAAERDGQPGHERRSQRSSPVISR